MKGYKLSFEHTSTGVTPVIQTMSSLELTTPEEIHGNIVELLQDILGSMGELTPMDIKCIKGLYKDHEGFIEGELEYAKNHQLAHSIKQFSINGEAATLLIPNFDKPLLNEYEVQLNIKELALQMKAEGLTKDAQEMFNVISFGFPEEHHGFLKHQCDNLYN